MRDQWLAEVHKALKQLCAEASAVAPLKVSVPPSVSVFSYELDERIDEVRPRFVVHPLLDIKASRMQAIIARAWRAAKQRTPHLWQYTEWRTQRVFAKDPRQLTGTELAERMRLRREGTQGRTS